MHNQARILIVTGPGKGKTTAAIGVIVRCLAYGKKVLLVRFAKSRSSGELEFLASSPFLRVFSSSRGMTPPPGHPEFPAHVAAARELFDRARDVVRDFDCIVLDEICGIVARNMIQEADVVEFLRGLTSGQTAVLTGRGVGPGLIAEADTVSEILCLKHGYKHGIPAQEGVEF